MKKGLSLAEVSVSIAVLVIVLASMLGIFSRGYRYLRSLKERVGAYNIARQVIEEYYDWNTLDGLDLSVDGNVTNNTYLNPLPYPVTLNNINYTVSLTVADGPCIPLPPCPSYNILKQITVTVSWTTSGSTKNFSLISLKANY